MAEFVDALGQAIFAKLKPLGRKVWKRFYNALKSVQQQITFDINGNPIWGIGLGAYTSPSITLDEIFSYLNKADKPCLIAIDEFQKIAEYGGKQNVEALLRTHIQRCNNAKFIFSGSKRHLMTEIFMSPSRPFYQSAMIIGLNPIPQDKYASFALQLFQNYGKNLDTNVVRKIYPMFDGVTFCLQRVMNILFLMTPEGGQCDEEKIKDAVNYILDLGSEHYKMLYGQMSERQRGVFIAIASERKAKEITGNKFIRKHRLTSASSVVSAVKGLLDKDFITKDNEGYFVYDRFFLLWLEQNGHIPSQA